ncbi:hypothetical protein [Paramaledivibacter caminithermalis]|uniref:Uncharacterized protein n=1 Tax=Paramaledivibacter caminithermalis (strain DSM 15212 / CIP 107654 / DViRD3) TaxID=1121301 RepID=A0A1M6M6G6_PARC5|nr:hypothetical protein [Paramaledivibacter caminithermalis]SHJ78970.1 hypothetical protein SAMN02745912_01078 [Paramaledivibacter caminithermalis DSM 15212]
MLNSISERRIKLKDKYKLYLEVPEKEYLTTYDNEISVKNARDILTQFLKYHQDDGRIENTEIKHDKNNHSINIEADLIYIGNDHMDPKNLPTYLNH